MDLANLVKSNNRTSSVPNHLVENTTTASSNCRGSKKEVERSWSDLPKDIVDLIRLCLFARDYGAFNVVCTSWRSIDRVVRPLPPPISCPHYQSPYLMSIQKNGLCKFFHPVYNNAYYLEIPEMEGSYIRFCNCGWVLLSRADRTIFFFNPFTKVKIELPRIPFFFGFNTMCFTSTPTSSDCVVMGFTNRLELSIGVIRPGEQEWFIRECGSPYSFWPADSNAIFYKGAFYLLGKEGNMGIYRPKEDKWNIIVKPFGYSFLSSVRRSFLAEVNGNILAVFEFQEEKKLQVSRLDLKNKAWRDVASLGDKVLYISRGSSFAETAVAKGMANMIYLSKNFDNNGVFYSLSTKKYHTFYGDFSSNTTWDLTDLPRSTWIKSMVQIEPDG